MTIKDLFSICDSFDDYTEFFIFYDKDEYLVNGEPFSKLKRFKLLAFYSQFEIIKFYIHKDLFQVDLLLKFED